MIDPYIAEFDGYKDDDLFITNQGVAYQKNHDNLVEYGEDYFQKYLKYEDTPIARKLNFGRRMLVNKYYKDWVLDVGIGSGEFLKNRLKTMGYDVNPCAVAWLKEKKLYSDEFESFYGFTFWDVLEHVPNPDIYLSRIPFGSYLFTSIPIFKHLDKLRDSKHYRPDEHLYYFTDKGFKNWMSLYGFKFLEKQNFEIKAGRDSIYSYAFQRV